MATVLPLVLSKLELKVPVFVLIKYHPLPAILWGKFRQYYNHVCSEQDLLSHLKGLQIGIFRFWQKETGAKRVALARAPQVSYCFICDVHFWRQVWRLPLQYFKKHSWFNISPFELHGLLRHHFPNLHNTKTLTSLERKQMCQKGKRHSAVFFKNLQISSNYFSFDSHFK